MQYIYKTTTMDDLKLNKFVFLLALSVLKYFILNIGDELVSTLCLYIFNIIKQVTSEEEVT